MLTDDTLREYIKSRGAAPDNSKYLLKDRGKGNFIAKWEYPFPEPKEADLQSALQAVELEDGINSAKRELRKTDKDMPRALEDLYDALLSKGTILNSDVDQNILQLIEKKKLLRAQLNQGEQ